MPPEDVVAVVGSHLEPAGRDDQPLTRVCRAESVAARGGGIRGDLTRAGRSLGRGAQPSRTNARNSWLDDWGGSRTSSGLRCSPCHRATRQPVCMPDGGTLGVVTFDSGQTLADRFRSHMGHSQQPLRLCDARNGRRLGGRRPHSGGMPRLGGLAQRDDGAAAFPGRRLPPRPKRGGAGVRACCPSLGGTFPTRTESGRSCARSSHRMFRSCRPP